MVRLGVPANDYGAVEHGNYSSGTTSRPVDQSSIDNPRTAHSMPRKIRDLTTDLTNAGFVLLPRRGKGDHRVYRHPAVPGTAVTLDGRPGDDAQHYREKDVREMIEKVRNADL
jgi:predicted RNA binding protein YcfA (HicA-like mRNA interferase family)